VSYTLKKSLGQHFLRDENICRKIVSALQEHSFQQLLEVGPGAGAITKYILEIPGINFKAVELDQEKVTWLETNFPTIRGKIIYQSFLEIDKPFAGRFSVVGNFPYNISSQILFKVLEWREDVEMMLGMFQKEVGLRVAAKPNSKDYGILSVLTQAFFTVEYLFEVHENCFNPPPKVKSAVIRLLPRKDIPPLKSERAFFNLVKTAFGQRRKMMRNPLKGLFDTEVLKQDIFSKRAEQLSVEDFAALSFKMK
jgi:16S rRNA (adenine1518-N6/adenine1519-N6)-dimethyltransferase